MRTQNVAVGCREALLAPRAPLPSAELLLVPEVRRWLGIITMMMTLVMHDTGERSLPKREREKKQKRKRRDGAGDCEPVVKFLDWVRS